MEGLGTGLVWFNDGNNEDREKVRDEGVVDYDIVHQIPQELVVRGEPDDMEALKYKLTEGIDFILIPRGDRVLNGSR